MIDWKPFLHQWTCSNSWMEESSESQGWKGWVVYQGFHILLSGNFNMFLRHITHYHEPLIYKSPFRIVPNDILNYSYQSDAHPPGDQEVVDSILAGFGNILSWRLIMKIFYGNLLSSTDSRKAMSLSGGGWSGGAKVSCILCHRGVQLILAYSWARPAILVAGKGREVMFLFLLFLHFHSCSSFFPVPLFHLFCYLFCLFSPFLWETTQNDPQGLTCR